MYIPIKLYAKWTGWAGGTNNSIIVLASSKELCTPSKITLFKLSAISSAQDDMNSNTLDSPNEKLRKKSKLKMILRIIISSKAYTYSNYPLKNHRELAYSGARGPE